MRDASPKPLVQVTDLKMHFPIYSGIFRRHSGDVKAVDGVSFDIQAGETLGLVGESGCGKSTVGRALLRLYEITAGKVVIDGEDVASLPPEALRKKRPTMQMVFQDPQASLNPRMTLARIISEPLDEHTDWNDARKLERVYELMDAVGLNRRFANRFPHEFSGGQRQRIGIARALALNPKFIVCDEPIAALDVSIQAQVVNLLEDLQERFGLTYLFISHDLSMVRHIADRVAVMYLGKIAELSPRDALYSLPLHPYAEALLSAVNEPDPVRAATRKRIILKGDVPSPANPPLGCNFSTRCPRVFDRCRVEDPALRQVEPGRFVACHLYDQQTAAGPTGAPEVNERNQQGELQ
ncbi:MAG: dipeptide ABC transporter ATP-binding protein [Tabrizicola sp.]|uniref:ABC transporter ATP-binding protein n=1 Tax=Tabrizicola sp. TaxID=2005166 RepID=UPI0027324DBB|nr:dipeptide ABC transporter ATP-binding protein [Tabrizicola sp.]MDP3263349.1 dipeptide ABC transporter ATP-binding protein [Tabrizicola sp.]MDP3646706.1 dipeptide ABC transporter ATP-binding protein [Paracoccaceae bacterium]MDZ4067532.1 dipeptide ABC transporter ATP-binding protein [Tabrizicola sp.]